MEKKIDNRLGIPDPNLVPYHVLEHYLPAELIEKYYDKGYLEDNYGCLAAREAIINSFKADNNISKEDKNLSPENVLITSGATYATSTALAYLRNQSPEKEHEILLLEPGYHLYLPQVKSSGFAIKKVPIHDIMQEQKVQNDFEAALIHKIEGAITSKPTVFMLTDPDNPTGRSYSDAFKKRLLGLIDKYPQLNIISDTIYYDIKREITAKSKTLFALATPEQRKKIYEIKSLSKSFLPAVRGGWVITDKQNIKEADIWLDTIHGQLSMASQLSIIAALSETEKLVPNYFKELNRIYDLRTDYVVARLSRTDGIKVTRPEGAFYVFADFSKLKEHGITAKAIVEFAEKKNVLLSYGGKFGNPDAIRISAARPIEELKIIMDVIDGAISEKGVQVKNNPIHTPSKEEDSPAFDFKGYRHILGQVKIGKNGPEIIHEIVESPIVIEANDNKKGKETSPEEEAIRRVLQNNTKEI